jgi:hypothetical protein
MVQKMTAEELRDLRTTVRARFGVDALRSSRVPDHRLFFRCSCACECRNQWLIDKSRPVSDVVDAVIHAIRDRTWILKGKRYEARPVGREGLGTSLALFSNLDLR